MGNWAINSRGGFAIAIESGSGGVLRTHIFGDVTNGNGTVLRDTAIINNFEQVEIELYRGIGISDTGVLAYSAATKSMGSAFGPLQGLWIDNLFTAYVGSPVPY